MIYKLYNRFIVPQKRRDELKPRFETGDIPTQQDFWNLLDSFWNILDDGIPSGGTGSGAPGATGATGPVGPRGSSGSSGQRGSSGSSGTSGAIGLTGPSGSSGTSGVTGSSGIDGTSGSSGYNGLPGSSGTSGQDGTSGTSGTSGTAGAITFYDEGSLVGVFSNVNFSGTGVYSTVDPSDSTRLIVYIPSPTFASHFMTTDGVGSGLVTDNSSRSIVRISSPTSEGSPFKTGGWAASNHDATTSGSATFTTASAVTGFSTSAGGNSNIVVTIFDADGTTSIASYTTGTLYQNGTSGTSGISVIISGYSADGLKGKASISVTTNISTILTSLGRTSGGKYQVRIVHNTDSILDGTGPYTYNQTAIFYDTNNGGTPVFGSGSVASIVETFGQVVTRYLSGVKYYNTGSKFTVSVDKINNLNQNTQGRSGNATTGNFIFSNTNFMLTPSTLTESAWSPTYGTFTGWTNAYDNTNTSYSYNNWAVATSSRYRGTSGSVTTSLFDPWSSGGTNTSSNYPILIDSVSGGGTTLIEDFNDETYRYASDYTTSWSSSTVLSNGQACVVGGQLVRPDQYYLSSGTVQPNLTSFNPSQSINYSGYSSDASFYRKFYNTPSSSNALSSFTMSFVGTFPLGNGSGGSGTDPHYDLVSGNLKIIVRKIGATIGTNQYGPTSAILNLHGNLYDSGSFNDGINNSTTDYAQIRTTSTGLNVGATFGGRDATDGIYVEIKICHSSIRIDKITVAFS